MSQIGTVVQAQEVPSAAVNTNTTANAFMVGTADWGPSGTVLNPPMTSLSQVTAKYGQPNGGLIQNSRSGAFSSTFQTLYDSADVFFREGGSNLYISRVMGASPTVGTLALADSASATCATLSAAYYGTGSGAINVVVVNSGSTFTVTLQDDAGNILITSPTLLSVSASAPSLQSWATTTNLVVSGASQTACIPRSVGTLGAPTTNALSQGFGGSVGTGSVALANYQTALTNLPNTLGPGQVMAPNQNNTTLGGIWSALATHAVTNNRVALLDGTDGNTATQAITEVNTAALGASLQGYCGIWAGNLTIPGITSGTTRTIAPSPVVAALCARADNLGNPNLAPAGTSFPLNYVSGLSTGYTNPLTGDISALNSAGINVFYIQYNTLQNFGFVSAYGVPANDGIYWQLSHSRLRMALVNQAAIVAQPFQFSEVDGQGQAISAFAGALGGMLLGYYQSGALYGTTPSQAFVVNASPALNTPASLAAGNLIALLSVRMSPFAQLVQITINAVPITQTLVQTGA